MHSAKFLAAALSAAIPVFVSAATSSSISSQIAFTLTSLSEADGHVPSFAINEAIFGSNAYLAGGDTWIPLYLPTGIAQSSNGMVVVATPSQFEISLSGRETLANDMHGSKGSSFYGGAGWKGQITLSGHTKLTVTQTYEGLLQSLPRSSPHIQEIATARAWTTLSLYGLDSSGAMDSGTLESSASFYEMATNVVWQPDGSPRYVGGLLSIPTTSVIVSFSNTSAEPVKLEFWSNAQITGVSAIPEPSALAMMLAGIVGIAAIRSRAKLT